VPACLQWVEEYSRTGGNLERSRHVGSLREEGAVGVGFIGI